MRRLASRSLPAFVGTCLAACAAPDATSPAGSTLRPGEPSLALGCSYVTGTHRTYTVTTANALADSLATAQAGDVIQLSGSTFTKTGGFSITRSGTASKPIVIQSLNVTSGTKATIGSVFAVGGNHVVLFALKFNSGGSVTVDGDSSRVTRNEFIDPSIDGPAVRVNGGYEVRVDFNDIGGAVRGISVDPHAASPAHGYALHTLIRRNYLHGWPGTYYTNGHEGIQVGMSDDDTDVAAGIVVEYNRFDDVLVDQETISIKSSYNTVQFNTLVRSARITNRHGDHNMILANWFEDSHGINVHDYDTKVRANVCDSCSMGFVAMKGDNDPHSTSTSPAPWADSTEFTANTGAVIVNGFGTAPTNPKRTRWASNTSQATPSGASYTSFTWSGALPSASKLGTGVVGPDARTCGE